MKNSEGVREEEEAGGIEKHSGGRGGGEGAEREDMKWPKGDKIFEDLGGAESCINTGETKWTKKHSGRIQAGEVRGKSHNVCRCEISRISRDAAGREAPRVLNLEKEKNERFI